VLICCFPFDLISFFFFRFIHGKWRGCEDVGGGGDGSDDRGKKEKKTWVPSSPFFSFLLIPTNLFSYDFVLSIKDAGDGGGKEHGLRGRPPWWPPWRGPRKKRGARTAEGAARLDRGGEEQRERRRRRGSTAMARSRGGQVSFSFRSFPFWSNFFTNKYFNLNWKCRGGIHKDEPDEEEEGDGGIGPYHGEDVCRWVSFPFLLFVNFTIKLMKLFNFNAEEETDVVEDEQLATDHGGNEEHGLRRVERDPTAEYGGRLMSKFQFL
jgi:hypothetical protein